MRLSDIKDDCAIEVIVNILDPIANIADDDEIAAIFRQEILSDGMTAGEFPMNRTIRSAPIILEKHRADIIAILAEIDGVSSEKYINARDPVNLMEDCSTLLADESFISLFTSAQSGTRSGSARANTGDHTQSGLSFGTRFPGQLSRQKMPHTGYM